MLKKLFIAAAALIVLLNIHSNAMESRPKIYTLFNLHESPLSKDQAQAIKNACEKLNATEKLFIQLTGSGTATIRRLNTSAFISLNADHIKNYTPSEVEFIVGHELSHYINKDNDNYQKRDALSKYIYCGFATTMAAHTIIRKTKPLFLVPKLLFTIPTAYLFQKYANNFFINQACELRADKDAAIATNAAQSGISFLEKLEQEDAQDFQHARHIIKDLPLWRQWKIMAKIYLSGAEHNLGLGTHPRHSTRIKALEPIAQQQRKFDKI